MRWRTAQRASSKGRGPRRHGSDRRCRREPPRAATAGSRRWQGAFGSARPPSWTLAPVARRPPLCLTRVPMMGAMPLPTEADLRAEAAALAPPSSWQRRASEELNESLDGRRSGLQAPAPKPTACRLAGSGAKAPPPPPPMARRRPPPPPSPPPRCASRPTGTRASSSPPSGTPTVGTEAACGRRRHFAAFLVALPVGARARRGGHRPRVRGGRPV